MNVPIRHLPAELPMPVSATGLAPSLQRKRLRLYLVQMLLDVGLLLGSFYGAGSIYFEGKIPSQPFLAAQLMLPLYLTIALHNSTYSLGSLSNPRHATGTVLSAMLIAAALLNFLAFFVKLNAYFSRVMFVGGLILAVALMAASRWAISRWVSRQWGPSPLNILQIDAGGPAMRIPFAYHIDAAEHALAPVLDDLHMLNRMPAICATWIR